MQFNIYYWAHWFASVTASFSYKLEQQPLFTNQYMQLLYTYYKIRPLLTNYSKVARIHKLLNTVLINKLLYVAFNYKLMQRNISISEQSVDRNFRIDGK